MTDTITHRGPDDSGIEVLHDGNVGLGFRRLSIIDLSSHGHQPMQDALGRAMIVYNGEVYNFKELKRELSARGYRFNSDTDTEVVLNAYIEWGTDCLDHFNGMFAFAIWDLKRQQLFLARDRFGIKPFYYTYDGAHFAFASEMKSLLQDKKLSRKLNTHAVWNYLTLLQIPAPETIYSSVSKLPPAHAMIVDCSGKVNIWRYWCPNVLEREMPEKDIIEQIRSLFNASVRRHLVADVPIGVFLSGGIDSSAIVATATMLRGEPIKTFSVSFPGNDMFDEAQYQKMIVDQYQPDHHVFHVTPNILDTSRLLIMESDEPFAVSSAIPLYFISKNASEHVKVVLSGDGGDELFGGYEEKYRIAGDVRGLCVIPPTMRGLVSRSAFMIPNSWTRFRVPRRAKKLLHLAQHSSDERYLYLFGAFGAHEKEAVIKREMLDHLDRSFGERYKACFAEAPINMPQRYFYTDLLTSLADEMLTKVDRCTSMVSIEGRVPFLDFAFSEFALSISTRHKYVAGFGKAIFRRAFEGILPHKVLWGKKRGFNIPMDSWTRSSISNIRVQLSDGATPLFKDIFNSNAVSKILDIHANHNAQFGHHIWALMQFNEWSRQQVGTTI